MKRIYKLTYKCLLGDDELMDYCEPGIYTSREHLIQNLRPLLRNKEIGVVTIAIEEEEKKNDHT